MQPTEIFVKITLEKGDKDGLIGDLKFQFTKKTGTVTILRENFLSNLNTVDPKEITQAIIKTAEPILPEIIEKALKDVGV